MKEKTKVDQIMSLVSKNNFHKVYFADDTQIYHDMLESLIEDNNPKINFVSFSLSNMNNGIVDLTNLINNYTLEGRKTSVR